MVKIRDPFIDNARFILVFLVVFGHLISTFGWVNEPIFFLNNFLSAFRMPAFILLTGFFAKSFLKPEHLQKITIRLFIPYLIFQFIYSYFLSGPIEWFTPAFGLWFLLSLYSWNLLLYIFSRLKHPILISIFLGIFIGMIDQSGQYFSISRTFVFFPFFLIGFYIQKSHFDLLKKPSSKIISLCAGIILTTILLIYPDILSARMLLGEWNFNSLQLAYSEGIILRLVFYLAMFSGIIFFLPWVPSKKTFFTSIGEFSTYIYILHLGIILGMRSLGWHESYDLWRFLLSPFIALGIVFILSSPFVRKWSGPFVTGSIVLIIKAFLITSYQKTIGRLIK